MDQFLLQNNAVVSSHVLAGKQTSSKDSSSKGDVVSAVARILGVNDPSTINPDTTLADLGLDSLMGVEIKQTLERDYNINMKASEIRQLTMNTLKTLGTEEDTTPQQQQQQTDVTTATATTTTEQKSVDIMNAVEIPTYSEETLVKLNDVSDNVTSLPIFLIHNIYGTVQPLGSLGKLLASPVYGVQYTQQAPTESIQQLSAFYIEAIKRVQPQGPYRIVGYSFGASVALEMSILLKQRSEKVHLVMLEGSQKYVSNYSVLYRQRYNVATDFEAIVDVLVILAEKITKIDKNELKKSLMGLSTVQSQITETFNTIMKSNSSLNKSSVLSYITNFVSLLRMGEQYKCTNNYSGDIRLIRAKTKDSMCQHLGEDLGVKEICEGALTTSWVEGDHLSILHGHGAEEIANIITAFC
jgi:fatty acid synthase